MLLLTLRERVAVVGRGELCARRHVQRALEVRERMIEELVDTVAMVEVGAAPAARERGQHELGLRDHSREEAEERDDPRIPVTADARPELPRADRMVNTILGR